MPKLIDVNTSLGTWPFQRFKVNTADELARHLNREGIDEAYVSHLGTVFYPDPDVYNRELIEAVADIEALHPVPVINPHLNRWQDFFDAYVEMAPIRAVKFIPSFHNYRLYTKPVFSLIERAAEQGATVMLQMRYEDERDRYFALNIDGPKIKQVVRLARRFPDLKILALNCYLPEAKELGQETDNVHVDIAFTEWMFTMEELRGELPAERILFGSHTPLLTTKSAVMKLMGSTLPAAEKTTIGRKNAQWLLENS